MRGMGRSRWAAFGAAVAVVLGAGGVSWVGATISSGSRAVFVPITPCRLVDTRPGGPGTRDTPLTAGETATFQVRGTNGDCTIPAGASSVAGNATVTDPTDDGFMTISPAGAIGNSSNLNWLRGQAPTPNAFTVALSPGGAIDVRNDRGTVNVVIDLVGYYEDHDHDDRYYTKAQVDAIPRGVPVATGSGPLPAPQYVIDFADVGFTTSKPGRALVGLSYTLNFGCTSPGFYNAWLIVDGVGLPTSRALLPHQEAIHVMFTGITPDTIPAGNHQIDIGVRCTAGTVGIVGGFANAAEGWAIELGSG